MSKERRTRGRRKDPEEWEALKSGYSLNKFQARSFPEKKAHHTIPEPPKPVTQVNKPVKSSYDTVQRIFAPSKTRKGKKNLTPKERFKWYPIYADLPGTCQTDLLFLPHFNNYIGMVVLVSINTKVAWAEPIKNKTSKHVGEALYRCVEELKKRFDFDVKRIEADDGPEFKADCAELMREHDIHLSQVSPNEGDKSRLGVVERLNRTLKEKLARLRQRYSKPVDHYRSVHTAREDAEDNLTFKDWVSFVPEVLHEYNYEDVHRTMGKVPYDVTPEDEIEFLRKTYKRDDDAHRYWTRDMKKHINKGEVASYLTQPKGNDQFGKPSQYGSWSKEQYDNRPYGGGPSQLLTNVKKRNNPEGDYAPIVYRPLPYRLSWHKLRTKQDTGKPYTEEELIAMETARENRPYKRNKKRAG